MSRPELQPLLGEIVQRGQALELQIATVLTRSLEISFDRGLIVANRFGVRGSLDVIDVLLGRDDFPLDKPTTKEWLGRANEANSARNDAIHTRWGSDQAGNAVAMALTFRTKLRTAQDLEEVIRKFEAAGKAFGNWTRKLESFPAVAGPTSWNEWRADADDKKPEPAADEDRI